LAVGDVVVKRTYIAVGGAPERADVLNRIAPKAELAGAVLWGVYFSWAEFVCLHTLETGRWTFAGPIVVWIALGVLALQTVGYWITPKLTEAFPSRFSHVVPSDKPDTPQSL